MKLRSGNKDKVTLNKPFFKKTATSNPWQLQSVERPKTKSKSIRNSIVVKQDDEVSYENLSKRKNTMNKLVS